MYVKSVRTNVVKLVRMNVVELVCTNVVGSDVSCTPHLFNFFDYNDHDTMLVHCIFPMPELMDQFVERKGLNTD